MARKPNENDLKYVERINELDQKLSQLCNLTSTYRSKIIEDINSYNKLEANRVLNKMPIDEINRDKLGIRVSLLKNNGMHYISDVLNASTITLDRINGIGNDSANTIKKAALKIQSETIKNCKFKIEMNSKNQYQTEVLKDIEKFVHYIEVQKSAKKLYDNSHAQIIQLVNSIHITKGWFGGYKVNSNDPETMMNNMDLIIQLVDGDYGKQVASYINMYNANNSSKYNENFYVMNHELVHTILLKIAPDLLDQEFKNKITNHSAAKEVKKESTEPKKSEPVRESTKKPEVVVPDFSDALILLNKYKDQVALIEKIKKESIQYNALYTHYLESQEIKDEQLFHYLTFKDFYDQCNHLKYDDRLIDDLKIIQSKNNYINATKVQQQNVTKKIEQLMKASLDLTNIENEYQRLCEVPFDLNVCKEYSKKIFKEDTSIYKTIYDSIAIDLKIQILMNSSISPYNQYASEFLNGNTTLIKKENARLLLESQLISEKEYEVLLHNIELEEASKDAMSYTSIELKDEKRTVVNDFKYIEFIQIDSLEQKQAARLECYFIDDQEIITNKVVIDVNQEAGHIYKEKFDFISKAYDIKKPYYLVINDYKGREVQRYQYKIDLAFSNDFDF